MVNLVVFDQEADEGLSSQNSFSKLLVLNQDVEILVYDSCVEVEDVF